MSQFKVTTDRDGRRSFGEHDDRWSDNRGNNRRPFGRRGGKKNFGNNNRGGGGGGYFRGGRSDRSRGGGYNRNSGGPGPRSRLDDEGDFDMGGGSGSVTTARYTPYGNNRRGDNRRPSYNNRDSGRYTTIDSRYLEFDGTM